MRILTLSIVAFALSAFPPSAAGSIKELKQREREVMSVVEQAMPSVVAVIASASEGGRMGSATGSGVVISKDGLVMTAGHVTEAAGEDLLIVFPDGRTVKGKSLGANLSRDAGLARIVDEGEWPAVEIGDSDKVKLGDWVVAMGHPGGYDLGRTPPVRLGRVVNKGIMGMIGTDCTLVGGDSGGPLFDLDGKVVGIHSSIGGNLAENRHVPASVYKNDWKRMLAGDVWGTLQMMAAGVDPDRPMLGVRMADHDRGVAIEGFVGGSPARKAGLEAGDIIIALDGVPQDNRMDFANQVSSSKAGDKIRVTVLRNSDEKEFTVTLARWEDLAGGIRRGETGDEEEPPTPVESKPKLGVILDAEAEADGAAIFEVIKDSPAETGGLRAGDVVFELDGERVPDAEAMAKRIRGLKPSQEIELKVRRGDKQPALKVKLGKR